VGGAAISTAQAKFGSSSIYLYGNANTYVSVPSSADLTMGTGDFTVEAYVYSPLSWASTSYAITLGGTGALQIGMNGTQFGVAAAGVAWNDLAPSVPAIQRWVHIAVTRASGALRIFYDGVQVFSGTDNTNYAAIAQIGTYFNGYLDDVRIIKGQALYTTNFIPPAPATSNSYTPTPSSTGHTVGDLKSITNPAGMVTTFDLYDPVGRILQTTDPKGVVTQITYTPRGWVNTVTTTAPGLPARVSTYTYDAAGEVTGVTTPDGASVSFSYDAAHRLIGATDAKGNAVAYTLDNAGNRIAEQIKDPTGVLQRSITRSFDALNRLQQVTGAVQ
jgi:YD repeat-containing protein